MALSCRVTTHREILFTKINRKRGFDTRAGKKDGRVTMKRSLRYVDESGGKTRHDRARLNTVML